MWSRVIEVMLGCWLAISPFVFRYEGDATAFWINDFATASAVILLALASFWRPLRHAHVLIAGIGLWLILFAYLNFESPLPPGLQSGALVGFLLMMFAVIPNQAAKPSAGWRSNEPDDVEAAAYGRQQPESENTEQTMSSAT